MSKTITIHGAIDPHVHLRDLDWSHKATFTSETRAAIAGGYWAVFDMPNTAPSTITPDLFAEKARIINSRAVCDWGLYFGASQTDNTAAYAAVAARSCGLKIYNNDTTGDLLIEDQALRDRIYAAWSPSRVIAVHAEEDTVLDILQLVRKYRKHTHFLHISTASEIAHLRAAKEEGLPVTIGVCPHHLFLTEDDLSHLHGFGMMKPSLKTHNDQRALWDAIRDGVVDVIESDHAPHSTEEKTRENPAFGVPGLETTLPLMFTAAQEGRIDRQRLINMVSANIQRIWGITPPPDTYTVIDLDADYELRGDNQQGACKWTPFEGMRATAKVAEVWIRGTKVYDGERVLVEAGFGQNLYDEVKTDA